MLCFNVNWNVFLINIRHVFLGAQRDHLSEMVLLSTHNICFSHQYKACVEGAQRDRLIETVLLSTYSRCFLDENQNGENGFPMHAFIWRSYFLRPI